MSLLYRIILVVWVGSTMGYAQNINVNFIKDRGENQNDSADGKVYADGLSPISYVGSKWTDTKSMKSEGLLDSKGQQTTIGFQLDLNGNRAGLYTANHSPNPVMASYWAIHAKDAAETKIIISGLVPGRLYDLALLSQGDKGGQGGHFKLSKIEKISTGKGPAGTLVAGVNYVEFEQIAASEFGKIEIQMNRPPVGDLRFMILNGFQLVPSNQRSAPVQETNPKEKTNSYAFVSFP